MGSTKKRRSTKSLGAVAAPDAALENGGVSPTGAERRQHTRVYIFGGRIEVSKINGSKRELRTPLVNISSGGIFIRFVSPARRFLFFKTKPLVNNEDLVHFNLFLPPNYEPIPICGRVVRYERIDKTQVGVGIEFSDEYTTERSLGRVERAIRNPVRNSERAKQIEDKRLRYSERLRAAHFEKNGEVINASQIIISSKKKKKKRSKTQSRRRNTTEAVTEAAPALMQPALNQDDQQEPAPKKRSSRRSTERIQRLRRTSAAELSMRPLEDEKSRSKKRSSKKRRKTGASKSVSSSSGLKAETQESPSTRSSKSRRRKTIAAKSSAVSAQSKSSPSKSSTSKSSHSKLSTSKASSSKSSSTKSTAGKTSSSKAVAAKSSRKRSSKSSSKSSASSSRVSGSSELKKVKKSEGRRSSRSSKPEARRVRENKRSSAEPRRKKRAEEGASKKRSSSSSSAKPESRPRSKRKRRDHTEASETKKKRSRSRSRPAHAERAHREPAPTRRFAKGDDLHATDIVPGDPTRTSSGRKRRPSGRRPLRARSMRTQVLTVSSDVVVADSDMI